MNPNNLWLTSKCLDIQTSEDIAGNFDIGFDKQIPLEVQNELRRFVTWVEDNFYLPVTLWVDFEYKHYLLNRSRKRMGYLFHWSDWPDYPLFSNKSDIPVIRLPVRTERCSMEEILVSFIQAISCYFAWISNIIHIGYQPDESDVQDILSAYLSSKSI